MSTTRNPDRFKPDSTCGNDGFCSFPVGQKFVPLSDWRVELRREDLLAYRGETGLIDGSAWFSPPAMISALNANVAFRVPWSTLTVSANPLSYQSSARFNGPIAGHGTEGWYAGGNNSSVGDICSWQTTVMAARSSTNLSANRSTTWGCANTLYAWTAGSNTGGAVATADVMPWDTMVSAAQASANLSSARYNKSDACDEAHAISFGGNGPVATADGLTYSTLTTAALASANLSGARSQSGCTGDSAGGLCIGSDSGTTYKIADYCPWSTDTTAAQASANFVAGKTYPLASTEGIGALFDSSSAAERCPWATLTTATQSSASSAITSGRAASGYAAGSSI